jgi:predicted outer membrane repeat protein
LEGDVLCAGAGVNHDTTIPFAITLPSTGPVILDVDTTGEDFSVYFFVAEAGDTIYVGNSVLADGVAGCGESGPDFTTDASGHGSVQTALMAAFMAVDDDEDTIVICDGTYTYTDDFGIFDGDPFHDSITVEAETDGGVILDGGMIWGDGAFDLVDNLFEITEDGFQILDVQDSSLAIQGLELRNGFADEELMESEGSGGGAIRLLNGSLTLDEVSLERNAGYVGGAVLVTGGELTATGVRATQNAAYAGGAIAIVEGYADIDGSSFEANGGLIYGGALLGMASPHLLVQRSNFTENFTYTAGGAIAVGGGNLTISGGSFIDNECYPLYEGCVGGAIAEIGNIGDPDIQETISISRALFRTNGATGSGGAIYVESDVLTSIYESNFIGNSATDQGGAIRLDEGTSETSIMGNTFSANHAAQGGAISINDGFGDNLGAHLMQISGNSFTTNSATGSGGALHLAFDNSGNVSPRSIRSNRFVRNTAPNGGAIVVESDFGSERTILRRFERALRSNRFTSNRAQDRRAVNIGVHFDE